MDTAKTTAGQLAGRVRKAIVAGASAGVAADVALVASPGGMLADGKLDASEIGTLVGSFFTAGIVAGYATWQTPNKPTNTDPGTAPDPASDDATLLVDGPTAAS